MLALTEPDLAACEHWSVRCFALCTALSFAVTVGCTFDGSAGAVAGDDNLIDALADASGNDGLTVGLRGLWRLDETDGDEVADGSGNGNHGTVRGASHVEGLMGTALSFNGDGDYLSLDNPDSLAFTGQITVSVWSRLASNASGFRNIVAHGHVSNPAGEYFLRVSNGNTYQGGSWDGGDHKATLPIPESDYGTWVHLASVYDGTSWHLYHAGVLVSSRGRYDRRGRRGWAMGDRCPRWWLRALLRWRDRRGEDLQPCTHRRRDRTTRLLVVSRGSS